MIENQLLPTLARMGPTANDPTKPFKVVKVGMVNVRHISEDDTRLAKIKQEYEAMVKAAQANQPGQPGAPPGSIFEPPASGGTGAGGFGGAQPAQPGGAAGAAGADDPTPFLDRNLGEDVRSDWEATIVMIVQLDPPPFDAAHPAPPAPIAGQSTALAQ